MQPTIELIVFDIAGTTVKDTGAIALAFQTALREFGYHIPLEQINPLMGYKKTEAIKKMLEVYEGDKVRITDEFVNTIHQRFLESMVEYYQTTKDLQSLPHAENVFHSLKERNIKVGLNTGFSKEITEVIVERLGWVKKGLVDYVVSSNEVEAGRPHPFMIRNMMQKAGIIEPKKVVKVGDTEVDVNEGKNADCLYSIGVTTGAFKREELEPYEPSFIIDDLSELLRIVDNHS
ncbi:HAD hydrolase-like protein [Flavisolibacter nicotianae]|uniref:HAD hydrolase-like protein n=1 Tax=Flavisolibacter nicotianae TaxID=2364882 RepID=UPI000EAEC81F|nr:HAD hydrolase-like protein [Flavisolibacter nicotianae]